MASIGSVSSSGSAWAAAAESRASAMRQKMFSKVDSDASGSVDATELQSMLDDIGQKTGSTAANSADVLKSLDTSGDGTLSQDELGEGMRSLMPAPSSTLQFAQQREGTSSASSASDAGTSASGDASTDASSAIDQGMPPPPPGGPPPGPPPSASASDSSSSASSTDASTSTSASTDPLDTNGDGTVSAQEQLVGDLKDLIAGADSDSDGKISSTELGAFETKLASAFTEALQAMQAAAATSSSSASSSQSGDSGASDGSSLSAVSASSSASQAAAQERVAQAYRQPPPERSMTDQAAINAFA